MKISIILPTFNRSAILKNTISNIQNQTFENYELIVINDASTDDTAIIIENFKIHKIVLSKFSLINFFSSTNPNFIFNSLWIGTIKKKVTIQIRDNKINPKISIKLLLKISNKKEEIISNNIIGATT